MPKTVDITYRPADPGWQVLTVCLYEHIPGGGLPAPDDREAWHRLTWAQPVVGWIEASGEDVPVTADGVAVVPGQRLALLGPCDPEPPLAEIARAVAAEIERDPVHVAACHQALWAAQL